MKYKLTNKSKTLPNGTVLFQIQALKDILNGCKKNDLGGWIQSKKNLSQTGSCWVYGYGDAHVYGDARVFNKAQVYGNAQVHGNAQVYGKAHVYGNAWVSGNAQVWGDTHVYGNAQVSVPINFNCDFNPWHVFLKMINNKEKLPLLMGFDDPNLNKIIEQKLRKDNPSKAYILPADAMTPI